MINYNTNSDFANALSIKERINLFKNKQVITNSDENIKKWTSPL